MILLRSSHLWHGARFGVARIRWGSGLGPRGLTISQIHRSTELIARSLRIHCNEGICHPASDIHIRLLIDWNLDTG
jgi:hypothetical protein